MSAYQPSPAQEANTMVTDEMVEKAADAMARQDITFANCDRGWQKRTIRAALEAALSTDAEQVKPVAWLVKIFSDSGMLLDTRLEFVKPVYSDKKKAEFIPLYAEPVNTAPAVAVKADAETIAKIIDPGALPGTIGESSAIAKAGKVIAALSAQVQDVAETKTFYTTSKNWEKMNFGSFIADEHMGVVLDAADERWANADLKITISAAPAAKQEGIDRSKLRPIFDDAEGRN